MKINNLKKVSVLVLLSIFILGSSSQALAAVTPSLGAADTFALLSSTFTRNIGTTILKGDLGYTTLSGGGTHTVSGSTHVADVTYSTAGADQGIALASLNGQACTYTFPSGAIDLATDTTHGPIGVYTPGVYCSASTSAASIGTAGITLDGAGTYIFRINGALTTVNNSNIRVINGASSCDVFWTPSEATTLGANTTFIGTVIDASGITTGHNTAWNGRALAFGGTVTLDTISIDSSCLNINPTVLVDHISISLPIISQGNNSGSMPVYGCKDPNALNYNYFSSSNPAICKYVSTFAAPIVIPSVIIPGFPKTGFPPQEKNISWYNLLFSNILNLFR
jgi:hypothetical protein